MLECHSLKYKEGNAMKNLVVFDFGTSKIKTLLCKVDNFGRFTKKIEFTNVSIGKLLSDGNKIFNDEKCTILNDFNEKINGLMGNLQECDFEFKAIATEAFRKSPELEDALYKATDKFGIDLEILTPKRECELLAANFNLTESDLLLDIGGGSINAIYKCKSMLNTHCYSLGAYVLHNLFQSNGELFDNAVYTAMNEYIKKELFSSICKRTFARVIVGSNQMLSFFNSLSVKTGLNFIKNGSFDANIVNMLINNVFLNRKYEDLFQYFEQNPSFMYGADKMLLILENFVKFFDIKVISPTDDGIALGFAKTCLNPVPFS